MANHALALTLVFGGCCSNALALEQLTATTPGTGTLLTFLQFLLVAVTALPNVLSLEHGVVPKFRARRIPIYAYALQVALFFALSRLNNAAFAHAVPMSVHIVFRSGGVVVNLLLGWLILGRRYTYGQILSVLAVSLGVLLTTLSASDTSSEKGQEGSASSYATGITLLSVALFLSGLLGIAQDWTFRKYAPQGSGPAPWKEAIFYLHALSLPLFLPSLPAIYAQLRDVLSTAPTHLPLLSALPMRHHDKPMIIPSGIPPLILTLATHLPCAAGANVLTSSMSSTSVALVLATRKAASLLISTVVLGHAPVRHPVMMAVGAVFVFGGSIGWAWTGSKPKGSKEKSKTE